MQAGEDVWKELWQELHHQGDVDLASYAAVPHLVQLAAHRRDWNVYALVGTIECERHRKQNPPIPEWGLSAYQQALGRLSQFASADLATRCESHQARCALALLALVQGQAKLGGLLLALDDSEIEEMAEERLCWSQLYRTK